MTYRRFCAALLCGVLLCAVAACDDPSTVGVGVGPDSLQGGIPTTLDVSPSSQRIVSNPSITGSATPQWRMLAGSVTDPLIGSLRADSYFDVRSPVVLSDSILEASADELTVELTMTPSYRHGDTTSTVTMALYDVTEEMDVGGATSDQTFPSESTPIRTVSISAGNDSLVTFELPPEWIDEHVDVIQDTTDGGQSFGATFHGFRLEGRSGNAVFGFPRSGTTMEVRRTGTDFSAQFPVVKQFSHIERTSERPAVDGRLVTVDGLGEKLSFSFDFAAPPLDTLGGAFVNRASIVAPVDTNAWNEMRPESFVRPRTSLGYRMTAIRSGTTSSSCGSVGAASVNDSTCAIPIIPQTAPQAATADLNVSLEIFRRSLLTGSLFSRYTVELAQGRPAQNTVGIGLPTTLPVAFYRPGTPSDDSTRATVTVTLQ